MICGHVDSGKSTTTGRLIFELGGIPERELEKLKAEAEALGKQSFAFAFYMDRQKEERERGVTISCTTKEFFTDNWHYTIIDALVGRRGRQARRREDSREHAVGRAERLRSAPRAQDRGPHAAASLRNLQNKRRRRRLGGTGRAGAGEAQRGRGVSAHPQLPRTLAPARSSRWRCTTSAWSLRFLATTWG